MHINVVLCSAPNTQFSLILDDFSFDNNFFCIKINNIFTSFKYVGFDYTSGRFFLYLHYDEFFELRESFIC